MCLFNLLMNTGLISMQTPPMPLDAVTQKQDFLARATIERPGRPSVCSKVVHTPHTGVNGAKYIAALMVPINLLTHLLTQSVITHENLVHTALSETNHGFG